LIACAAALQARRHTPATEMAENLLEERLMATLEASVARIMPGAAG
jgi:hypothetical protein